MTESDRFSLLYSAAFGGAVRDIYCALLNGAALFPLMTMHHIISDDWSMQVIQQELSTLYRAFVRGNPENPSLTRS